MLLIAHTQIREEYGSCGASHMKNKGGSTYLLARLSARRAAELGKAGLAALVAERRPQFEHDLLPLWLRDCGDYEEYLVSWELVEDDYQTEEQRLWAEYPEMRGPWEKTRPCLPDRTEQSDRGRLAEAQRWTAEGVLCQLPGESRGAYHARARDWHAVDREVA